LKFRELGLGFGIAEQTLISDLDERRKRVIAKTLEPDALGVIDVAEICEDGRVRSLEIAIQFFRVENRAGSQQSLISPRRVIQL
jgi:hypothetical protein